MSKKTGLYFFCMLLTLSVLSASFASALTGAIGNARMILKAEVGETVQKYILVKNVNNISLSINLSASGELEKYINILDNNFVLQSGEEKKAYFTIKAKNPGSYESKIDVKFTPQEGNGIGLSSTIILVAYGKGEMPDETDETNNDTGIGDGITGGSTKDSSNSSFSLPVLLLVITPILLIVLLIVLANKKRGQKGGKNLKLNSKKEMRHR